MRQTLVLGRVNVRGVRFQSILVRVIIVLLLTVGAVLVLMPMAWMLSTSLKEEGAAGQMPPQWIPMDQLTVQIEGRTCYIYDIPVEGVVRRLALLQKKGATGTFVNPDNLEERYQLPVDTGRRVSVVRLHWENYPNALTSVPFGRYALNSLRLVVITTIGVLLSCTLVAYGFARFRARGLGVLFIILLCTIMLPPQVTLIPTFVLFQKLKWYDTLLPLTVPAFFGNAWDIFLLRQYMMTIPLELDDAARIDGCGPLGILWHVIVPQTMPALATVAIFHSLWSWNDFFGPLIYLKSQSNWTVALGLQSFNALYSRKLQLLMAASTVMMLPCILIFFSAQRLFIQGIVISGVKG
ncbi:MAG: carbohydrate ABC transporter permease [Anaerolineae bacterium]|nr:carbohydrate ABC transporter permease [Anaerolineae bacterium]